MYSLTERLNITKCAADHVPLVYDLQGYALIDVFVKWSELFYQIVLLFVFMYSYIAFCVLSLLCCAVLYVLL